jgi:multidrug efflux pump subunit AcrB
MGIVTKNSILLVDYAVLAMRTRGFLLQDALLDACHKRARPIVMTTAAMVAGNAAHRNWGSGQMRPSGDPWHLPSSAGSSLPLRSAC